MALLALGTKAQDAAQGSSSAAQTANLVLNNSISIAYVSSGTTTGSGATMQFNNANDYASGVMSTEQELVVMSNEKFTVAVRCDESSFSYQGSSNITMNDMPSNALWLKVTDNNTGGTIKAPFSTNNFASLTAASQDLLINANRGGNQKFAVMYKCTPGFSLPAGVYSMDVVYTATQQ